MAPQQFITMANKFQSVLDEDVLNERGHQVGFAKRERLITPCRFGLSVVASMATQQVQTLADLHRQFNELWERESDDKAFYTQRLTSTSPAFFRTSLCHIMRQLTMKVLGFEAGQAFSAFTRLLLQDGRSFALHKALAEVFPGRFHAVSPAAIELHCTLDGCDRAIPNELRRLWPRLRDFRHLLLNHRHRLRRQVPLMDGLPDPTEPEHSQVQDDLSPRERPRHPRTLEALGEHRLARGLRDAGADGQALAARVPIPHPMGTFFEVRVGLVIDLGCAPQPVLPSQG